MVVFPNAKINLGLNITAKRPDGYHEISTLMFPVDWSDILEIVPASGQTTTLTVTGHFVDCPAEKNLVMKAYRRMAQEVELPDVDIFLHKVIPDGAGLGGGSSDAAFTLKALNSLFCLDFTDSELAAMAADLGADCPFFIYNKPMLAEGIGTELTPVDFSLANYKILIAKPDVSVSTKEAYAGVTPKLPDNTIPQILAGKRGIELLKNDFEESVFALSPQIAELKQTMLKHGARYASMSGSGSSVFGLFDKDDNLSAELISALDGMKYHLCGNLI